MSAYIYEAYKSMSLPSWATWSPPPSKPAIGILVSKFRGDLPTYNHLTVGGTEYMDLTSEEHFLAANSSDSKFGNAFHGTDVHGRQYIAFKLNVKEFDLSQYEEMAGRQLVKEYNTIHTIFERYSDSKDVICIANSHRMYDTGSVFIHNVLNMCGLRLDKNSSAWQRLQDMVKIFANGQDWSVRGVSSANNRCYTVDDAIKSEYVVSINSS